MFRRTRQLLSRLRPQRRDLQFSLRTLLLVTLVVALGLAWWLDRLRLETRVRKLEERFQPPPAVVGRHWGPEQATGLPNTPGVGDIVTAWASATPDGQPEWLLLHYDKLVQPTAVLIHESFNPGALTKVSVFDANDREVVIWTGTDPTPPSAGRGVTTIPVQVPFKICRVKIYLDSPKFPGWNEIDAVGLEYGWLKSTLWASKAEASSYFGQPGTQPPQMRQGSYILTTPSDETLGLPTP